MNGFLRDIVLYTQEHPLRMLFVAFILGYIVSC